MPLDPQAQKLLDQAAASGLPPAFKLPVADARQLNLAIFVNRGLPEPVHKVEEVYIPNSYVKVRIYTPEDKGPLPILVFFHGGGWSLNNLDTHDALCRRLANGVSCIVVSVDYRLAPEYKFPTGNDDSYLATRWVADNAKMLNGDPDRIAVAGDSSGGTQAIVVCLMAKERGGPKLIYQLLFYPPTDYYVPGTKSYEENATGYSMSRAFMIWFWDHYLNSPDEANNPYACPLKAPDLSGLPPALIFTAEYDPLRDEGEMYAKRLKDVGIEVEYRCLEGMMHGFILRTAVLDKGRQALEESITRLRAVFNL